MTATNAKIEAVARAICQAQSWNWQEASIRYDNPGADHFREVARAALHAASDNEAVKATAVFKGHSHGAIATIFIKDDAFVQVEKLDDGEYYLNVFCPFEDITVNSPPLTADHFDMLGSVAGRMRAEAAAKREGDGA